MVVDGSPWGPAGAGCGLSWTWEGFGGGVPWACAQEKTRQGARCRHVRAVAPLLKLLELIHRVASRRQALCGACHTHLVTAPFVGNIIPILQMGKVQLRELAPWLELVCVLPARERQGACAAGLARPQVPCLGPNSADQTSTQAPRALHAVCLPGVLSGHMCTWLCGLQSLT